MLQTQLESRFGDLQSDELAALQAAEVSLLRSLAAHVLADNRDEVRALLGIRSGM